MNAFLQLIIDLFRQGLGLAVGAILVYGVVLAIAYAIHRGTHREKRFSRKAALWGFVLAVYIAILLSATIFRYPSAGIRTYNLHFLRALREAWNQFSLQAWLNVLLNIALFIPLGALLPLLFRTLQKWYFALAAGFFASLLIEGAQWILCRGIFDVDDLLANTLGYMFGYAVVLAILTGKRKTRGAVLYLLYPVLLLGGISGIFVGYSLQEYGNLQEAPAFTVNLTDVEWNLAYTPDDTLTSAPVYKGTIASKAEIRRFADSFASKVGISFPDVYYYDTTTVFANHTSGDFLTVSHQGFTYEYTMSLRDYTAENAKVSEDVLREMVSAYGIEIPTDAEFRYEGNGKHTFSVDMLRVGDKIIDGTVSCSCKTGDILWNITNEIVELTPYKDTPVRSQSEAYALLCRGKFNGAEYYKQIHAKSITVLSCAPEYRVDSKGFYQPVYRFQLQTDSGYEGSAVIPARK